jgi:NAD(P)-dependent dehydrogenase (short-subunit alcohol dehydrogenase family)
LQRAFGPDAWGVILGGSSGFGLATAQKLAAHGLNPCLVHRDRRGALARIQPEVEKIRGAGVALHTWKADAPDPGVRAELVAGIRAALGPGGRVRVLLHSIAFGNLKPLVAARLTPPRDVANVVYLRCLDEAAWINGALVRVDGGEHVAGSTA